MRMKGVLPIAALLALPSISFGQTFKAQFDEYFQRGDSVKQLEVLHTWQDRESENAELLTSYFNYYLGRARQTLIALTTHEPEGESLALTDSTGKPAGYMGNQVYYDPDLLEQAFSKIDQGIGLYPDRLDMRFGKVTAYRLTGDWKNFTEEIVRAIRYSDTNKNQWTWTNNEHKEDGEEFFLSSIQGYQSYLYETGNDSLLTNMRTIAEETLKYYPNDVEALSDLSITYLLSGAYDEGINALLKAEKINPKDGIILGNIAQGYKLKGDIKRSISYFEKMLKLDDPASVSFATQQIEALKK